MFKIIELSVMNIEQRIDAALSAAGVLDEKSRLVICLSILLSCHIKTIERRFQTEDWRVQELPILAMVLGVSQADLLNPHVALQVDRFSLDLGDKWSNSIQQKVIV